jgi:hypothetical protein
MQANLNKSVQILDDDKFCYHLKVESVVINPNDPKHPIVKRRMLILGPLQYKRYFGGSVDEQIGYLKAMGLENVELVHDPSLEQTVIIEREPSAEEKFIIAKRTGIVTPMRDWKKKEKTTIKRAK